MKKSIYLFIDADRYLRATFNSYKLEPDIREAFSDWCAETSIFPAGYGEFEIASYWTAFTAGYRKGKLSK